MFTVCCFVLFSLISKLLIHLATIGSGAYGIVWKGSWRGTDVAVKEVRDADGKDALLSEVAKLQNLRRHQNVIQFYGCTAEPIALVVEFAHGGCLVDRCSEFNAEQQLSIARGIAQGVRHLHLEKLVHRDLVIHFFLLFYLSASLF